MNMASAETERNQIQRKQDLVAVLVTQVCFKEQKEDLVTVVKDKVLGMYLWELLVDS